MKHPTSDSRDTNHKNRIRSSWLSQLEGTAIAWLCRYTPSWVTSDLLTGVGLAGSIVIGVAFFLGKLDAWWLLLVPVGLAVNWLGDSMDGRLAYFRNQPRKWYGFVLDLSVDWLSLTVMTIGMAFYFAEFKFVPFIKFVPFVLMAAYGARMLIATLSYKLTNQYRIDSGLIGPTEVRLIMAAAVLLEIVAPGSLVWLASLATAILLIINVTENYKLLAAADEIDRREKLRLRTNP